ncbi:hypothetical protein ABE287_18465 [Bacillus velezensis]
MINTIFDNKYKVPIRLTECTLFIDLKHYEIEEAVFFKEEKTIRVNRTDSSWMGERVYINSYYKGYITCEATIELITLLQEDPNSLSLIGYTEKGSRVMLTDLNFNSSISGGINEFKTYTDLKRLK